VIGELCIEPRSTNLEIRLKAGIVCPAFFMRSCHLKQHFFFLWFYFDAVADLDYCINSNQKP